MTDVCCDRIECPNNRWQWSVSKGKRAHSVLPCSGCAPSDVPVNDGG